MTIAIKIAITTQVIFLNLSAIFVLGNSLKEIPRRIPVTMKQAIKTGSFV